MYPSIWLIFLFHWMFLIVNIGKFLDRGKSIFWAKLFSISKKKRTVIAMIIWTFALKYHKIHYVKKNPKISAFYEKLSYGYHHPLSHLREDQGQPSGVPFPTFYQEPGTVSGSEGYRWPRQKMPTSASTQETRSTTTGCPGRASTRGGVWAWMKS